MVLVVINQSLYRHRGSWMSMGVNAEDRIAD